VSPSTDNIIGVINSSHSRGVKGLKAQESINTAQVPPPIAMLQLISGFWISGGIYITAKLELADLVKLTVFRVPTSVGFFSRPTRARLKSVL
jgi:hypothetical protein